MVLYNSIINKNRKEQHLCQNYHPEGNKVEDLAELINLVKEEGIDIINVSAGGVIPIKIEAYPGYQIKLA